MCRDGEGRSEDNRSALEFFKEGIKHGNDECWGEMAKLYYSEGHKSNEEKCWSKYFSSGNFVNFSFRRNHAIYDYVRNCILDNKTVVYARQIIQVREETLQFLNEFAEVIKKTNGDTQTVRRCSMVVKGLV